METTHPTVHDGPRYDLSAAIWAGVVASIVFQLLEIICVPLFGGGSPWGPARMIAAMVLGPGVLPPPATFDLFVVSVALLVDVIQAMIYAAVLAAIVRTWSTAASVLVAAVFGVALYAVNFYLFAPQLFPWFTMGRNGATLFTHVVFSVTAALTYKKLQRVSD
jgi:hypothetical protein